MIHVKKGLNQPTHVNTYVQKTYHLFISISIIITKPNYICTIPMMGKDYIASTHGGFISYVLVHYCAEEM